MNDLLIQPAPADRPLIVGESNPYQTDERRAMRYAMHPDPPEASGGRLCFKVMQLDEDAYLRAFDRIDLCHPHWSLPKAREKAQEILAVVRPAIILCGRKVADAFGVAKAPVYTVIRPGESRVFGATTAVLIPHPSATNRMWWDPAAFERARDALRRAGVLPVRAP
jgi:hypothetical protein